MNSRRIIVFLAALLLAAFAIGSSATVTAKAATSTPARQATAMGVTSSGQIINLARPPSWLKPNTLIHPLNYLSPDRLDANGYYICFANTTCLNNWNGGGQGNLIRWFHYSTTLNPEQQWNWWFEGTVGAQQSWPFRAGSGINNTYNNNPVYKFAYAPYGSGSGNCMSQQLFGFGSTGSNLNITTCACGTCQTIEGSKFEYFVLDGNGRLVAVEATNLISSYYSNNNLRAWVGVGQDGSSADGAYAYLVSNVSYSKLPFRATL